MSKQLYVLDNPDDELPESCLDLDDDILDPIYQLVAGHPSPEAWSLFGDLYGNAEFNSEDATKLAIECEQLAAAAPPVLAIWLQTISAFAREAGSRRKCLRAFAD